MPEYNLDHELSLKKLEIASDYVWNNENCFQTPIFFNFQNCLPRERFPHLASIGGLHLKLESFQKTGSFKIRGVVNQMRAHLQSGGKFIGYCKGLFLFPINVFVR